MDFYTQTLSDKQKELLPKLGKVLNEVDFYLAGGTALALQLGHRTSLDFDFYTSKHFDPRTLSKKLARRFAGNIKVGASQAKDTLFAEIDGVKFSAFYYPYILVNPLKKYEGVETASVEDIAAMKVAAVVQRGKQRDFIDIYYLIKELGLEKILEAAYQKYPWYKDMGEILNKSLTYFTDADNDKDINRIKVLSPDFSWPEAKRKITEEVKKLSANLI